MIPPLTDRISLLEHLNERFPGGVGVEVGVAGAHFARQILATWRTIGELYLIDPWKHFEDGRVDGYNLDQETQDARYRDVVEYFKDDKRVNVIRQESLHAAKFLSDFNMGYNFIYIDANHSYQANKEDAEAWWLRLKRGGILAGHDYYDKPPYIGVKQAVDEFAKSNNLTVHVTTETYSRPSAIYGKSWEGPSWVIEKP